MECFTRFQAALQIDTLSTRGKVSDANISAGVLLFAEMDVLLLRQPFLRLGANWVVYFHHDLVNSCAQQSSDEGSGYRHPPPPISRPAQIQTTV